MPESECKVEDRYDPICIIHPRGKSNGRKWLAYGRPEAPWHQGWQASQHCACILNSRVGYDDAFAVSSPHGHALAWSPCLSATLTPLHKSDRRQPAEDATLGGYVGTRKKNASGP